MIRIDVTKCIGCSLCVSTCSFNALCMENGVAALQGGCTSCGMCVQSCPVEAISVVMETAEKKVHTGILVFAETKDGTILDVSLALCQKASRMNTGNAPTYAVVFGYDATAVSQKLIDAGADIVFACSDFRTDEPDEGLYAATMVSIIRSYRPEAVLFGATSFGRSLAPRLAARLGTGLTADCTELSMDDQGLLRQTRPAFGGNLLATIVCPNQRPQMATIRPGVFPYEPPFNPRTGRIIPADVPKNARPLFTVLHSEKRPPAEGLADAEIIVTAGRGIGDIKNMKLVKAFAERIGAEVALTRPLADAGYGEQSRQIGQTGQTVSPKLLITLGVSGAIQHIAGIGGAKTVIAVNTDPDAPIFAVADYAIVCDCVELMQRVLG